MHCMQSKVHDPVEQCKATQTIRSTGPHCKRTVHAPVSESWMINHGAWDEFFFKSVIFTQQPECLRRERIASIEVEREE